MGIGNAGTAGGADLRARGRSSDDASKNVSESDGVAKITDCYRVANRYLGDVVYKLG